MPSFVSSVVSFIFVSGCRFIIITECVCRFHYYKKQRISEWRKLLFRYSYKLSEWAPLLTLQISKWVPLSLFEVGAHLSWDAHYISSCEERCSFKGGGYLGRGALWDNYCMHPIQNNFAKLKPYMIPFRNESICF